MTANDSPRIFYCSFCENRIKFRPEHEGRRLSCPKCKKTVCVYDNQENSIASKLESNWFYEQPRILGFIGSKKIGPINDNEFLSLFDRGDIRPETMVSSPEITRGQEVPAVAVNVAVIREMRDQQQAEKQRVKRLQEEAKQKEIKNHEILLQGIRKAISDGNLSLNERSQLYQFATRVGLSEIEVDERIAEEAKIFLDQVIEDSIADGMLDDDEIAQLSQIAIGLGLSLKLDKEAQVRLELARFAWRLFQQIQNGDISPTLETNDVELFEIVSLKRPAGIPLGNDHYLKHIGSGTAKVNDKNLLLDGRLNAKKYALNSIASVEWFADGLFLKRSSGKSIFLRSEKASISWHQFSMKFKAVITGEPVLGVLPDKPFVPDGRRAAETSREVRDFESNEENEFQQDLWQPSQQIPRFTFRVVGESHGDRLLHLNQLSTGDAVYLVREPANSFDPNAVAVVNRDRKALGYLKREVSSWFAPIIDKGRKFRCEVDRRTSSGSIIIAVFD